MGQVKSFYSDLIEHNHMRLEYPVEYDNIHQDCEGDIHAYGQQLMHVKSYAPVVVREHKEELIKHLIELAQYVEDL
jgi:hypothetical protein